MFAKMFKSKNSHSGNSSSSNGCNISSQGATACKLFETNPLHLTFEIGPPIGNGGPEGVWRIHKGTSKDDNKVKYIFKSQSGTFIVGQDIIKA